MEFKLPILNIRVELPLAWQDAVEEVDVRQGFVNKLKNLIPYLESKISLENVGNRVQVYLQTLMQSLQLPMEPRIAITACTSLDNPESGSISMHVGDRTIIVEALSSPNEDNLVQLLSLTLFRVRSLWLTDELTRGILADWYPNSEGQLDKPDLLENFRWLFKESLRYGLHLGRFRDSCDNLVDDPSRRTAKALFEEKLGEEGLGSLRLFLSRAQYNRCFESSTGKPQALEGEKNDFAEMMAMLGEGLYWELGLQFSMEDVEIDNELESPWFRMQWNDILLPPIKGLQKNEFLVNDTVDRLTLLNLNGQVTINPVNGSECASLRGDLEVRRRCEQSGLTTWGPEGYLILHLSSQIRQNAGAFMSLKLWELYANQLRQWFPFLVDEAIRRFDSTTLTRTLRELLNEEISIRDLVSILEAMISIEASSTADFQRFIIFDLNSGIHCPVRDLRSLNELTDEDYAQCVRMALKRYISHKYTKGSATLAVYLMDPDIEARLTRMDAEPLTNFEHEGLIATIRREVGFHPSNVNITPILTTIEVRRPLRRLIETDLPWLPVMSYQELQPELNIQPIAIISFDSHAT